MSHTENITIENKAGSVGEGGHNSKYAYGPWEKLKFEISVEGEEPFTDDAIYHFVDDKDAEPGDDARKSEAEVQGVDESAVSITSLTRYQSVPGTEDDEQTWKALSYVTGGAPEEIKITNWSQLCICEKPDCTLRLVPTELAEYIIEDISRDMSVAEV
ncbi:hypothetical protein L198_02094 [Cryptococcus wingfieldii CBS 7118]|uniref:Uncharacterized protein n=1 Tax=Cryptococcus wingfieldii CBS 7118 TaxID=1295528 RepID=A0A1E3JX50_9TREE|nr:hypothetical protein L198_02094 [Cryptococcus wingfieldii CBS 7118]ODO05401.1 hypothetical protein L198_02094 [Cryptococcus wingfieldii CBS 7118]